VERVDFFKRIVDDTAGEVKKYGIFWRQEMRALFQNPEDQ
jgi:hypothetical protein